MIECKNEAKLDRGEIYKTETGQTNNSYSWFTENYPGARVHPVMIINTKTLGDGAGFNMEVTIMRERGLRNLCRNVKSFYQEFLQVKLLELGKLWPTRFRTPKNVSTVQSDPFFVL